MTPRYEQFDGAQSVKGLLDAIGKLMEGQERMGGDLRTLSETVTRIDNRVQGLDARTRRQEARLAAIESSFRPLVSQPPRLYTTESHSIGKPARVRTGHAG